MKTPAVPLYAERDESTMAEARALLARAFARMDELSEIDQQRLVYLEQRSTEIEQQTHDSREVAEDLFHKANNALFIVSVNINLITRGLVRSGDCGPELTKSLTLMAEKIDEIALVNRHLMAAGTGGAGPLYLIHSYISLRSVIQRALEVFEDVAHAKEIRISWEAPAFPAVAIWTDGIALGTVLDNLLSNAIKFSPAGSEVKVAMHRTAQELICTVTDEGPGLSRDEVARLFQRGTPLGPRPTGGESSSGYGLAISRDVVHSLGGRIWCESTKGSGASFIFALPTDAPAIAR